MENNKEPIKIRMSTLVLIKESNMVVFNDQVRVVYKHPKTFKLIWTLCNLLKKDKYKKLGGVPAQDLVENFKQEGFTVTKEDISTLWYDEVLFKRHHSSVFNLYDAFNFKHNSTVTSTKLLEDIYNAFFVKISPPEKSRYHRNSRFYTVSGEFEQVLLFNNVEEAEANGYNEAGISQIARHRTIRGVIGFLDWQYKLKIDEKGGEHANASVKMVNLSSRPLGSYMLPLWSNEPIKNLKVKLNQQDIDIDVTTQIKNKQHVLEFVMKFPKPIMPGEIAEFDYSFYAPKSYKMGHNYFDWYFDQPQSKYQIDIYAPSNMKISSPIVYEEQNEDVIQAQKISPKHVRWIKHFPQTGFKYIINFALEK